MTISNYTSEPGLAALAGGAERATNSSSREAWLLHVEGKCPVGCYYCQPNKDSEEDDS